MTDPEPLSVEFSIYRFALESKAMAEVGNEIVKKAVALYLGSTYLTPNALVHDGKKSRIIDTNIEISLDKGTLFILRD